MLSLTFYWFSLFSGFSGQIYLNEWAYQLWNTCYSAFPIFIFALFERDVPKEVLLNSPEIYKRTQNGEFFNAKVFRKWILLAVLHSVIVFFFSLQGMNDTAFDGSNGQSAGIWCSGIVIYTSCVFVVNLKLAMLTESWTWLHTAVQFCTIIFYFFSMLILNSTSNFAKAGSDYYYVLNRLMFVPKFYFIIFVTIVSTLLVDYVFIIFEKLEIGKINQIVELTGVNSSEESEEKKK